MKIIDHNIKEISELQQKILLLIVTWARVEPKPISRKAIIDALYKEGVKPFTVINSLRGLQVKGYIRRAVTTSNKTNFVLLRSL